MKILHVIISLDTSGSEMSLLRLLQASDRDAFVPELVSLTDLGSLAGAFEDLADPLAALGLGSARQIPARLRRLSSLSRLARPDVVQRWMYHSSAAAWIAGE